MRRINRFNRKICLLLCCAVLCSIMYTGCGSHKNKNGSMLSDDGRSYGGLIEKNMGDTVHTAFFDLTVEEAVKCGTYAFQDGLYQADAGKTYLLVKVTVKNTYAENLSMSITDFVLDYKGNKAKEVITGYGKSEVGKEEFMDNLFTLRMGESITGTIMFTVEDKEEYQLKYVEYYADNFEGDTFQVTLKPETEAPVTETPAPEETPTEAPAPEGAPTEAPAPEGTPTEAPAPEGTPTEAPAPEGTPTEAPAPEGTPTEAPAAQ